MTKKEIVKVEEKQIEERKPLSAEIMETVLIGGDLSKLTPKERVQYYLRVCESTGLNPYTRPFQYIVLNGRLVLYADKNCAEQLRDIHGVSVYQSESKTENDVFIFTVYGQNNKGRKDVSTGAVNVKGLAGDMLANAIMKAETKAKRRLTLSICGMGMLDETEIETIPEYKVVEVDPISGELPQEAKEVLSKPVTGEMTLDTAGTVVSSDGQKYVDIDSQKLAFMANAIQKKLDKGDAPEKRDIHLFKLDAIKTILQAREASGAQ